MLELVLLFALRLSQVLALQIEPIVDQRGASLEIFRELSTDIFRHETYKIVYGYFETVAKLSAVL